MKRRTRIPPTFDELFVGMDTVTGEDIIRYALGPKVLEVRFDRCIPLARQNALMDRIVRNWI